MVRHEILGLMNPTKFISQFEQNRQFITRFRNPLLTIGKIISLVCVFHLLSCNKKNKIDEKWICGDNCKLWKEYNYTSPSMSIYCFQKDGHYIKYYISTKFTKFYRPLNDCIQRIPDESGHWKIENDSLYIDKFSIGNDKVNEDTILIDRSNYFLVNYSNFTDKDNCNCDSLSARFNQRGWEVFQEYANQPLRKTY